MRVTATPGNIQLTQHGHYAQTSLTHHSKEKTTLGQTSGIIQGDWRKRNNDKPVTVVHTTVDTTACL